MKRRYYNQIIPANMLYGPMWLVLSRNNTKSLVAARSVNGRYTMLAPKHYLPQAIVVWLIVRVVVLITEETDSVDV